MVKFMSLCCEVGRAGLASSKGLEPKRSVTAPLPLTASRSEALQLGHANKREKMLFPSRSGQLILQPHR